MQKYNTITVLKLPNCNINAFGIVQIAEMITNIGCVQDLNLDMNPNAQENYHLLCAPGGSLKYLSLRLCKISDDGAKKIANELRYRDPPNNPKLIILNLANNHITKDGAGHIGEMLRTNRSLRCLVLLGNRMCDEGARLILQELKIITLKHEEIVEVRRRKFAELALMEEWKIKTILGHEMCHPHKKESFPMNGKMMAIGNLELQYLDLSFNHLTNDILQETINCLYYQNYMLLGDRSKGLLYVLIEGGGIDKQGNKDWNRFDELLRQRQSGERLENDAYREFVSQESEILRRSFNSSLA
ncbi:hypothetical protein K0M31_009664 [Melipona bicolor]|uniref:Uncharacterized protein n=1 Tax=Melipona bicolor TaxID=60889 RepID=A0AA40FNM6_9HYME|nr:hypothetical protein K0M31_009664 [Melipona bicolor]